METFRALMSSSKMKLIPESLERIFENVTDVSILEFESDRFFRFDIELEAVNDGSPLLVEHFHHFFRPGIAGIELKGKIPDCFSPA